MPRNVNCTDQTRLRNRTTGTEYTVATLARLIATEKGYPPLIMLSVVRGMASRIGVGGTRMLYGVRYERLADRARDRPPADDYGGRIEALEARVAALEARVQI